MDLVHIDLLGLETTMNTKVHPNVAKILVITDHFSCHMQAYKVKDKRAVTIAKCLYDNYFRHYGFPRWLMSDQGKEFCNNILKEMCYYLNIKKICTMPYHPQSNGSVERVHYTLHRMIRKLDNKRCKNWVDHLSIITHTYNVTRSQITGYSPYFLMMGRRPQLPVDLLFPTSRQLLKTKNVNEYVKVLHGRLCDAICTARISADQEVARHKRLWLKSRSCWTPPLRQSVGKIGRVPRCLSEVSQLVEQYPTYSGETCSGWRPCICDRECQRRSQSTPLGMASSVVILWWGSGRPADDSWPADNLCFLVSPGTISRRWEEM